jgi:hypothetical protein
VPHLLTDELKQKRIEFSKALLDELICQEMTHVPRIITGDESLVFFEYSHDHIWSLSGENMSERVSQTIESEKY